MNKIKRILNLFFIFGLGAICIMILLASSERFKREKPVSIGIFLSFSHPAFEECSQSFQKALHTNNENIRFVILNADYSVSKARQFARRLYQDTSVRGIFTIGALSTKVMSQMEEKKPLVFSGVHDAEALAFYKRNTNIHGIEDRLDVDQIFFAVKSLNASPKSVVYLQAAGETFSHILIRDIKKKFLSSGIELFEEILSQGNIKMRVKQILDRNPSIIFLPLDPLVRKNISFITEEAFKAGVPLVTGDFSLVDQGVCAVCNVDYKKAGAQAALMMDLLLKGECSSDEIKKISLEPLPQFITFNDDRIKELGLTLNKADKQKIRSVSFRNEKSNQTTIS
ncbi:MAG: ABC transporter substrate binding protein [Victivallaceae bacterium]